MPPEKRAVVDYLIETHALSIRKACEAIDLSRSAWYRPLVDWLERDRSIAEALLALAETKPGLEFWKLFPERGDIYRYPCGRWCYTVILGHGSMPPKVSYSHFYFKRSMPPTRSCHLLKSLAWR